MALRQTKQIFQGKWHILFAVFAGIGIFFFLLQFIGKPVMFLGISSVFLLLASLIAVFGILQLLSQIVMHFNTNMNQLHRVLDTSSKVLEELENQGHDIKLTDNVKSIAYKSTNRLTLGEAVLGKLHQKDFNSTYKMIDAMEADPNFAGLASKLRDAADKYKNATDEERVDQVISHIETLAADQRWQQASQQIQRLQKWYPESEKVKVLPQRLRQLKEDKKKQLLQDWESATGIGDTEKSLSLLQELDKYLTPSEGLALQETVSGLFRAKLQSLGVRFSLAVSDGNWKSALEAGEEIVKDFPNSKMAHEILSKIDILREKVKSEK